MVTIAWAEDHDLFSANIQQYIKEVAGSWLTFDFIARNGLELLEYLKENKPDIVLLDIRMPTMDGIETARIIMDRYPELKIIAFTEFDFEENVIEMYKVGVKSFVSKSNSTSLIKAIRVILDGGVYLPDNVASIVQKFLRNINNDKEDTFTPVLTDVEALILKFICEGKSSVEIGDTLCRSPRTIEEYREKLYKKFDVRKKEELIVKALQFNLV